MNFNNIKSSLLFAGECFWLDGDLIRGCISSLKSIFPVVEYSYINIPSYPCGQIGFFMASKSKVCLK